MVRFSIRNIFVAVVMVLSSPVIGHAIDTHGHAHTTKAFEARSTNPLNPLIQTVIQDMVQIGEILGGPNATANQTKLLNVTKQLKAAAQKAGVSFSTTSASDVVKPAGSVAKRMAQGELIEDEDFGIAINVPLGEGLDFEVGEDASSFLARQVIFPTPAQFAQAIESMIGELQLAVYIFFAFIFPTLVLDPPIIATEIFCTQEPAFCPLNALKA